MIERVDQQGINRRKRINDRVAYILVGLFFPWLAVYLLWIIPFLEALFGNTKLGLHLSLHLHLGAIFLTWCGFGLVLSLFFPPPPLTSEDEANIKSMKERSIFKLF
jgi:hypothetical protein